MERTFSIRRFRLGVLLSQEIPFSRENFRSGRQNYSFRLQSIQNFRSLWVNGKQSKCLDQKSNAILPQRPSYLSPARDLTIQLLRRPPIITSTNGLYFSIFFILLFFSMVVNEQISRLESAQGSNKSIKEV